MQTHFEFFITIYGFEINAAVETVINNKQKKRNHKCIQDLENHTKLEAFIKQMYTWQVHASVLAEPCVKWRNAIPRKVVTDISKKYDKLAQTGQLQQANSTQAALLNLEVY